jgi:hypothetical protein
MKKDLEHRVRHRAKYRCEYCQMPQSAFDLTFPIDHIIAQQHGGRTISSNLALACLRCNRHKGPNLAGIDPIGGEVVPLFHPRRDRWPDHFLWLGLLLMSETPTGRATIRVLTINDKDPVQVRRALKALRLFPPTD